MTTTFTGFFKSAGNEAVYIAAIKGDGFEIVLETRNPEAAEKCLRDLIPAEKVVMPTPPAEDPEALPNRAEVDFDDEV